MVREGMGGTGHSLVIVELLVHLARRALVLDAVQLELHHRRGVERAAVFAGVSAAASTILVSV